MAKKEVRLPPHLQRAQQPAAGAAAAAGAPPPPDVQFKYCELFHETSVAKSEAYPTVGKRIEGFISSKAANKMQPFGSSDKTFNPAGNFAGFKHAHLTHDISIVYDMAGAKPTIIQLYGLFSHDELGTGSPPSKTLQQAMATKFRNQVFK